MLPFRSTFIKIPKHKKFEFKPRYFNPEKEAMEERLRNQEGMSRIQNGKFSSRWRRVKKAEKLSNQRVYLFIALLLVMAYLLFR